MSQQESSARMGSLLRTRGLSISTAESLTGGMLGAVITGAAGASGGAITYATESKAQILSVAESVLATEGPVSPKTAEQMANGVRLLFGSSLAVSTTGVAGPTVQDGKPVGLVYIGVSDVRRTVSYEFNSAGATRDEVRQQTVDRVLEILIEYLEKE